MTDCVVEVPPLIALHGDVRAPGLTLGPQKLSFRLVSARYPGRMDTWKHALSLAVLMAGWLP